MRTNRFQKRLLYNVQIIRQISKCKGILVMLKLSMLGLTKETRSTKILCQHNSKNLLKIESTHHRGSKKKINVLYMQRYGKRRFALFLCLQMCSQRNVYN